MKTRVRKTLRWLPVFIILPLALVSGYHREAGTLDDLKVDQIDSFEEMQAALSVVKTSAADAVGNDTFTSAFQKNILARAGECISRLAYLCRMEAYDANTVRQSGKALFMKNEDIIKKILTINEEKIVYLQEAVLDTLEDPLAFFQTPHWQDPRQLISISSYCLGWNGYYASLVIPESDPERKRMLMEAIDGFSRAFIDFEEETVIAKSLYGRGLCYKQRKDFQNALYDFKTVKDLSKKEDLLYAKCLFEEASISYDTGNFRLALGKLDKIHEVFPKDSMPESMNYGVDDLRANIQLSQIMKKSEQGGDTAKDVDSRSASAFNEMRPLAVQNKRINKQFYRYVQTIADQLANLPYSELGPVATMAIGDCFFDKKDYDNALFYYRQLLRDMPLPFNQALDRLKFRTATIFYVKQQWQEVVKLLDGFHEDFSDSRLAKEAGVLYYTAASKLYKENGQDGAYEVYIAAIQKYLEVCDGCEARSELRFQLGRHYQKFGKYDRAINEFSAVKDDSPNFFQAKYYVLESCLKCLDGFSKKGSVNAEEKMRIYREGLFLIDECRRAAPDGEEAAVNWEKLQPYMAVLQAKFYLHGKANAWESGLRLVQGFEQRYPEKTRLFSEAAKLRIEFYVLLQREKHFETEVDRFMGTTLIDPLRYAQLHALANSFYTKSKKTSTKAEKRLSSRFALAALAIYEKLGTISMEDAAYANDCESIALRMAEICMQENRIDRAAELYSNVLERNRRSADAVYGFGLIYERKGQWRKALQAWRKFSDGVEEGTYYWFQSRYRTAVALHQIGETKRACTVMTMTRVLHPYFGDDELERNFRDFESNICRGNAAQ